MGQEFSYEENNLLALLKEALCGQQGDNKIVWAAMQQTPDWERVFSLAEKHAVLPLLYDVSESCPDIPDACRRQLERVSRRTAVQNYRLLFLTKYLIGILREHHITAAVMKGVATASFYPVPELRKSGDIDILIPDAKEFAQACLLLDREPTLRRGHQASHHLSYQNTEGIEIEVHTLFSEPFERPEVNRYLKTKLQDCAAHIIDAEVMGVRLPLLDRPYHAFQLLLHMLQHFLSAGFGLKLLCDWVRVWQQDWSETELGELRRMITDCRITGFTEMIFAVCVEYLGLPAAQAEGFLKTQMNPKEFLKDILEAEEFGNSKQDRSVAMQGTSLRAYASALHHQMKLSYPKLCGCAALWPALWVMTAYSFFKRRRGHVHAILKKTGNRSKIREELKLFEW